MPPQFEQLQSRPSTSAFRRKCCLFHGKKPRTRSISRHHQPLDPGKPLRHHATQTGPQQSQSLPIRHLPPLLQNLHPQPLSRQLHIQNRPNPPPPRLLQSHQLPLPSILRHFPLSIHILDLLLRLRQLLLHPPQYILQLRIPNQPRILAILL